MWGISPSIEHKQDIWLRYIYKVFFAAVERLREYSQHVHSKVDERMFFYFLRVHLHTRGLYWKRKGIKSAQHLIGRWNVLQGPWARDWVAHGNFAGHALVSCHSMKIKQHASALCNAKQKQQKQQKQQEQDKRKYVSKEQRTKTCLKQQFSSELSRSTAFLLKAMGHDTGPVGSKILGCWSLLLPVL